MPNDVTNILKVKGNAGLKAKFFDSLKTEAYGLGSIDFNKVIPMPEHIFRGNLGKAEREQYGKDNWYDWSCDNWGTKWNSYGYGRLDMSEFDGETVYFCTAWGAPLPVIKQIAKDYSELSFEWQWADEDLGNNVGEIDFEKGEMVRVHIPEFDTKEAWDMAAEIIGIDLEAYGFKVNSETGTYEYVEEFEEIEELPEMQL